MTRLSPSERSLIYAGAILEATVARDGLGRFRRLVCVNAHDLCYATDECPYCEFAPIRQQGFAAGELGDAD